MIAGPLILAGGLWSLIEALKANPEVAYDIIYHAPFHITQDGTIVAQIVLFLRFLYAHYLFTPPLSGCS